MERANRHARPPLGRMTRRTIVVSTQAYMVHASIKLWRALTTPDILAQYHIKYAYIFR